MNHRNDVGWADLGKALLRVGVDTLVLIGPHGSGKSTLRARLADGLGWRSDLELGALLREEALARDSEQHAQVSQPEFDAQVMKEELARDADFLSLPEAARGGRVIETWHPGNLAYAYQRSPEVYAALLPDIRRRCALQQARVWVIPLSIQPETLQVRLHEPGPSDADFTQFLWAVGARAFAEAEALGLHCLPPVQTDGCGVEDSLRALLQSLLHRCGKAGAKVGCT